MIDRFNRKELLLALLGLVGGMAVCWFTFLFFRFAFSFAAGTLWHFRPTGTVSDLVASGVMLLIAVSGYATWRNRGGFYAYHESGLYHRLRGGSHAYVAGFYAHRLTGPAYLLSQIFLAGPLFLLSSLSHFKNRVPVSMGLEERLQHALETLQRANKWQSIDEYPDLQEEILLLAKLRKIDFSVAKGTPRIKASLSEGEA